MQEVIFDIEADNLYDKVTKIHCLSYKGVWENEVTTYTKEDDIVGFFSRDYRFIGHNILRYDLRVLKKLLGIGDIPLNRLVDTLPLSWYLFPDRPKHGLEDWGETFGVPKPKISDWENLELEDYINRCSEDVKINTRLWELEKKQLEKLYGT